MENNQYMCYITYAVPAHILPKLVPQDAQIMQESTPAALYPTGFMPEWYRRGSFPEDDFED